MEDDWDVCRSPFWNNTLTWNTSSPDFTLCFERTALIWTPCAFLWVFSPLEVYYLIHSKTRNVPWNLYNITKLAITLILSILCIADVGYAVSLESEKDVPSVNYYTPFVLFASFLLTAILVVYNRIRGMVTSGLLFFFWFLLMLCGVFQYRSEIVKAKDDPDYSSSYFFISYMIYFPLVVIQFILHCFADKPPLFSEHPTVKNPCPEQTSSALSRLLFAWFDKLAWLGFRKPLETSDLWSMNPDDTAPEVVPKFDKYWEKSVRKNAKEPDSKASFRRKSGSVEFSGTKEKKRKGASILPAIARAFGPTFLFGAILKLVNDCLTFVNPKILELLIGYIEGEESEWKGYFYAVLMLITATIQTVILSQYFQRMFLVGLRIRTALISAIYRKALRMSNSARKESTVGEIVNLMSVDAQRFMDLTTYLNMIWSAPLQIALALYFLWDLLGPSVLAGLAVMIILIPLNGFIASKVKTLQIRQMKNKDERVKLMNEVLSGIKVLKLYAWEPSFEEQILKIRNKEIQVLKEAAYLNAGTSFIWSCAPFLVFLSTITTFTLSHPREPMTAKIIFVAMAYFNILRFPFTIFPLLLFVIVQVSLATLGTYVLVDGTHEITATIAFVSLNYFNAMRFPMNMLPMLITFMVQVCLTMFAVYVFTENDLNARRAFVSLAFLNVLRRPFMLFPMLINALIQVTFAMFGVYVFVAVDLNARRAFVSLSYLIVIRILFMRLPLMVDVLIQANGIQRGYFFMFSSNPTCLYVLITYVQRVQMTLAMFGIYVFTEGDLNARRIFVSLSYVNVIQMPLSVLPRLINGIVVQVSLVTFGVYVFIEGDLNATKAFVSLSYFNVIRQPLAFLPYMITSIIQVIIAPLTGYVLSGNNVNARTVFGAVAYLNVIQRPVREMPFEINELLKVFMAPFTGYVLSGNEVNALTVFGAIAFANVLQKPLRQMPNAINEYLKVSLVTFASYVLSDEKNVLDSKTAFVSLSLFNILRFPLSMLPMMISNMVQASVSVKRINKFMNADELDPNGVSHDESDTHPLTIENGSFTWDPNEKPTLKNINLQIKQGQLVAVVGSVGSGKSSLISAFLGEMERVTGRVNTKGSIAYVPQQAWIQNATLRDNILFGKTLDGKVYNSVVDACALKPDFDMLPGGDRTEIGEKGINLSGGQKQRVSLARAVYHNSDVYFLDDPLSAVDSHVGKHIFERVVGPSGILRNKTRILVTHGITYLPEVDWIVVLKDGEVSETGTYKELLDKKGAFAEFLITHLQESGEEASELDLEEIKTQLEGTVGAETIREIQRQISESRSETGSLDRRTSGTSVSDINNVGKDRKQSGNVNANGVVKPSADKLIEIEKAETGSVKWNVYSHYLKSIGISLSVATVVMNMIFQGFSIGSNVWLSEWSNANSTLPNGEQDTASRDKYLGVYGALGVGQGIFSYVTECVLAIGCIRAAHTLHTLLFLNVLKAPVYFFDVTPSGRILQRFSKDMDVLDTQLPIMMSDFLSCLTEVIATLVVISYSTPIFIAVIVPIGILYYFIQRFYVATSRQLKRIESVSRSPIYSHFGETVTGTQTIRAYNVQSRFIHESEQKVDFNQICYYPSIIANRWLAVRLEMVGNLIIFFAALFAVLSRDTMNSGLVGLSVTYALQITQTLNWLVRMTSDVETNIVAVERIKEYGETPQEAPWENPDHKPPGDWPKNGDVEFVDYKVRYRENLDLVLHGINFKVVGGEKVGIVGRTGAGKSSLTLALFRIIESANGKILIDGIDISKLGLHDLRTRLTIIPQDPVLFSGTVRMNLDPFNRHTDEEIWRALENAHLKAFIQQLPLKLDHEVSEGGENLSVGQRQLVCLARALLRKTKILILDEATAAVDLETDDLIQKTIRTEFKECTVLTIAHRLNTILDSDRVIVLDRGLIAEFDNPQKLLSQPRSVFYSMAKDAGITAEKKKQ